MMEADSKSLDGCTRVRQFPSRKEIKLIDFKHLAEIVAAALIVVAALIKFGILFLR